MTYINQGWILCMSYSLVNVQLLCTLKNMVCKIYTKCHFHNYVLLFIYRVLTCKVWKKSNFCRNMHFDFTQDFVWWNALVSYKYWSTHIGAAPPPRGSRPGLVLVSMSGTVRVAMLFNTLRCLVSHILRDVTWFDTEAWPATFPLTPE